MLVSSQQMLASKYHMVASSQQMLASSQQISTALKRLDSRRAGPWAALAQTNGTIDLTLYFAIEEGNAVEQAVATDQRRRSPAKAGSLSGAGG